MPQSGKLPVLNLLTGQKSFFFYPAGATHCIDSRQTRHGRRALRPLGCAKCHLNRRRWWECGRQNIKNFHFLLKASTVEPRDRVLNFFTGFYTPLGFQIWRDSLDRLQSYCWVTARPSIMTNFSVHPVGKTMRWMKKWMTFFDGLDELYHQAKFGEDRATRAGCRCENVVFVCIFDTFFLTLRSQRAVRSTGA